MKSHTEKKVPRALSSNLELRRASCEADLQAVLECHVAAFGEEDEASLRSSLLGRPGGRLEDTLFVVDTTTADVVSSVGLVPQTWTYEGIPFPVGQASIVSTRVDYRGRGLVREQFSEYHRMARRAGCVMSVIEGIPYFYRQFGYEYSIPMGGGVDLRPELVPDEAGNEPSSGCASEPYRIRTARPQDLPILQRFYKEAVSGLCVASIMPEEIWEYQDALPEACGDGKATYVVEGESAPVGYMRMVANEDHWHKGARIVDAYLPRRGMCMAALRFAKRMALEERETKLIRIETPHVTPLTETAVALGGKRRRAYAWQVRILDSVRFVLAIAPALEQRLADSAWAGMSQDFAIGSYTEAVVLRFRDGGLLNVATLPRVPKSDLRCPPQVLPMIWLGYRSVAEVIDWYTDAACKDGTSESLANVLFPKRDSWISSLF